VQSDQIVFDRLRSSGAVGIASSEEKPEEIRLGAHGYSVCTSAWDHVMVLVVILVVMIMVIMMTVAVLGRRVVEGR
jgi:hypothetical protein